MKRTLQQSVKETLNSHSMSDINQMLILYTKGAFIPKVMFLIILGYRNENEVYLRGSRDWENGIGAK